MSKVYRINEFAKRIGRAPSTVRRWEREGILVAKRLPSGHRYFDESDVRATLGGGPEKRSTVVYCRVSSAGQRDDLQSQVAAMEEYCRAGAIAVDEWIQEVGGGMNFKRKRFLAPIERIQRDEIERVLIALIEGSFASDSTCSTILRARTLRDHRSPSGIAVARAGNG
jgi:Predicted site-specific integrase-resolvase